MASVSKLVAEVSVRGMREISTVMEEPFTAGSCFTQYFLIFQLNEQFHVPGNCVVLAASFIRPGDGKLTFKTY